MSAKNQGRIMRRVVRLSLFVALASGASAVHAQPVSGPSGPAVTGQPGVNVYSTLYPRPPSSTVTQPSLPVPAGGMTIARVPEMLDFYGSDVMLLIGGALLEARERLTAETAAFVKTVRDHRYG